MPTLTITKTYLDGNTLYQSDLDGALTSVETFVNTTKLDSTNLQNGAVLAANMASNAVTSACVAANAITTAAITNGNVTAVKLDTPTQNSLCPSGSVVNYAGASAPSGWFICDGSAVPRTTYATLFTAISTTWGAGDGSTTFNIPDLRGRATVGVGTGSGLTARALAAKGGEETHVLLAAELPTHTHSFSYNTSGIAIQGGSAYTMFDPNHNTPNTSYATDIGPGTNTAHNNMQPYVCLNYIIKT